MAGEETKRPLTLEKIRAEAEMAVVRNLAAAVELLVQAADSRLETGKNPDPLTLEAARLHLEAARRFVIVAQSGKGERIPNSEAAKGVM